MTRKTAFLSRHLACFAGSILNSARGSLIWKFGELPLPLGRSGGFLLFRRGGGNRGYNGISGGGAGMPDRVSGARCMPGGSRGGDRGGVVRLACRGMGLHGRCPGHHHLDLTSRPRPSGFNGSSRPAVGRVKGFEVWEHMLGAIRRPKCKRLLVKGRKPGDVIRCGRHSSFESQCNVNFGAGLGAGCGKHGKKLQVSPAPGALRCPDLSRRSPDSL